MILPFLVAALALHASDVTVVKNRRLERNQTVAKALYDALNDQQTYSIMEARQTVPPQLIFDEQTGFHIALVYYECQIRNP